jgi:hypothetical protein
MALTTRGIAIQLLGSLRTHSEHKHLCSDNDCIVTASHLIRKYSDPLFRDFKIGRISSVSFDNGYEGKPILDHAIPVILLVKELMERSCGEVKIDANSIQDIETYLRDRLLLVKITKEEDQLLSSKGFQRKMPESWVDPKSEYFGDKLARYKVAGIALSTSADY